MQFALTLLVLCPGGAAQTAVLADWEISQDQEEPYGPHGAPLAIEFASATVVAASDLDGDGVLDLVHGGPGDVAVQITYLHRVGHGWAIKDQELLLPGSKVLACYDIALADMDGDGDDDIVVGRRLQDEPDSVPNPSQPVKGGLTDTIYLNERQAGQPGTPPLFDSGFLPICNPSTTSSSACSTGPTMEAGLNLGATFNIVAFDADWVEDGVSSPGANDHVDVVACGDYGVRLYRGVGGGAVEYVANLAYPEPGPDACQSGTGHYRSLSVADLDGDGDLDIIASRMSGRSTRVFLNTAEDGGAGWAGPFVATDDASVFDPGDTQDCIMTPTPQAVVFQPRNSGGALAGDPVVGPAKQNAFGTAVADLDGDGNLDLVIASTNAPNTIYHGDGSGFFGSSPGSRDGQPAHTFPVITPDWSVENDCFEREYVETEFALHHLPGFDETLSWEVLLPGVRINHCTDVAIADCNGDGRPDVAFSNRSDILDSVGSESIPDVHDFLFFNRSTPGDLAFDTVIERLGAPRDGTGYGEFFPIDDPGDPSAPRDSRPDWVDANFSNQYPNWVDGASPCWIDGGECVQPAVGGSTEPCPSCFCDAYTDESEINLVFWGHEAVERSHTVSGPPNDELLRISVSMDMGLGHAGQDCTVLASTTLVPSTVELGGLTADSPITADFVTQLATQPTVTLDADGRARVGIRVPLDALEGAAQGGGQPQMLTVYLVGFVSDGVSTLEASNPVTLPPEAYDP